MGNIEIREPKQQRSIEKKQRIIKAGFELFCQKGYHNTNTAEIAKLAGVSTGIVYNYFKNKRDIFIDVVKYYSELISKPLESNLDALTSFDDIESFLERIIDLFVESHTIAMDAHEEMLAMSHSDSEIGDFFRDFESKTILLVANKLSAAGIKIDNPLEKLHITFGLIENFCHEVVYHNSDLLDYNVMKKEIINLITTMLKF